MARDEDIFKRLNRQTPIVKQKELQPLSSGDFSLSRNTISIPVVSPDKKRSKKESDQDEPVIFDKESRREAGNRQEQRRGETSGLAFGKEQESYDESPRFIKKEAQGYEMPKAERRAVTPVKSQKAADIEEEPKLVFPEYARPEKSYDPRSIREESEENVYIPNSAEKKEDKLSLRHELKFYINYRDYVLLRSSLKSLISADPNADGNNSYHVRSLYFDDIYDSALAEKIAGSDYRKKYRIRIYNFRDDNIKFEKKFKIGQYIGKKSINLTRREYESIIAGDYYFLLDRREELAKEIFLEMKNSLLRPKVIVDYMREAYVSPLEECRITFDKDLKASLMLKDIFDPQNPVMPMYESGIMVLEVKFNKFLPEYIKRVLNIINAADRCAISKYVICRNYN